jgi:hypothetical protein
MKILYIPLNTSTPETDGFYKALKKKHGEEVEWYWDGYDYPGIENYKDINMDFLPNFDLIHLQSGTIKRKRLEELKHFNKSAIVTQWTGDYRPEPMEMITQYEGLVDITFLAAYTPGLYPKENVKWLPHGVDDWQFREVKKDAEGIVMIANNYPQFPGGKERAELNDLLKDRKDYTCYGSGFENSKGVLDWYKAPDIYNNAKFAVGCNIYNDVPLYFSTRPLNAMAAGTCFFMKCFPRSEEIFDLMDCMFYNENLELQDKLHLSDYDRNRIAKQGQKKVKEKFHYDNIVKMYEDEILKTN